MYKTEMLVKWIISELYTSLSQTTQIYNQLLSLKCKQVDRHNI